MPRYLTPRGMRAVQAQTENAAVLTLVTIAIESDRGEFRPRPSFAARQANYNAAAAGALKKMVSAKSTAGFERARGSLRAAMAMDPADDPDPLHEQMAVDAAACDGGDPLFRVVNDLVPCVSRGRIFEPRAFQLSLPDDTLDKQAEVNFQVDNVDQFLTDMIRQATTPACVIIEVVVSDTPDVTELLIDGLKLRSVEWNSRSISGKLRLEDIFGLAFPSNHASYDPVQFPGLFA